MASGGRWNAPGAFPVLYLNRTVRLSRLYVAHKLRDEPYGPEDLDPESGPILIDVEVPPSGYVDVVSDAGCLAVGLPKSYPVDGSGDLVPHPVCWPIGQEAWHQGEQGVACRSATQGASRSDEELAWFQRDQKLQASAVKNYADWFFS